MISIQQKIGYKSTLFRWIQMFFLQYFFEFQRLIDWYEKIYNVLKQAFPLPPPNKCSVMTDLYHELDPDGDLILIFNALYSMLYNEKCEARNEGIFLTTWLELDYHFYELI